MDTGIDAAKIASKGAIQKTAESTRDLNGNKIADKITSMSKSKEKTKKAEEFYVAPKKDSKLLMT